MSTLMRPTGPLSPGVYWVRRLLVLLVVLAVIVGGWWLFIRSDAAPSDPSAGESPAPVTTSPSATTQTTPADTTSASPSDTPGQPECKSKDIEVGVTTDATDYADGVEPKFTLTVTNVGDVTCRRDVGQKALELIVTSGDVQVWSSDDCNPGGPTGLRVFEPTNEFSQSVTWSRQLSEPGCPTGEPLADPGQYQVVARNLDLTSAPASFTLK